MAHCASLAENENARSKVPRERRSKNAALLNKAPHSTLAQNAGSMEPFLAICANSSPLPKGCRHVGRTANPLQSTAHIENVVCGLRNLLKISQQGAAGATPTTATNNDTLCRFCPQSIVRVKETREVFVAPI